MIPITWMTFDPVWVPQWPLSREKLLAATQLVTEQIHLGHLEESTSPWNTPIFVIKKKSGKWRLLHDLRAINQQMQLMGPIQRGLPVLSTLPRDWPIIVVDIKDCFFSIPLHKNDRERFAFTLPTVNHEYPDKRYQWIVLPQGMANSPTMCQLYVDTALQPLRKLCPSLRIIHYMDDILLAAPIMEDLEHALTVLVQCLQEKGLYLAPEKIQRGDVTQFLGARISHHTILPQKLIIRTEHLQTLNDFQKLLGDINWLRPYLKLTRHDLMPLFRILEGDSNLLSPRSLTPEAITALSKVEQAMSAAQLIRFDPSLPLWLCILPTFGFPTAVLWQDGPLLWIHTKSLGLRTLTHYPSMVAEVAILGIKQCLSCFAVMPDKLIIPYTKEQMEVLIATVTEWSILACMFPNVFDNHLPKSELLKFVINHPILFPKITASAPLKDALTIYTDGSKSGKGAYMVEGSDPVILTFSLNAPQLVECEVVLTVFNRFPQPFNLVSDSLYVVNAVKNLELVSFIKPSSIIAPLLVKLRACILQRVNPFYITHIRAHSLLPGPMASANARVDLATRAFPILDPLLQAQEFHALYHVSSVVLRKKFFISRAAARKIVKQCPVCVTFTPVSPVGVNPRGLLPNSLWQMDVTHFSSFGKLQYIHVSIDTCSGVLHATPLAGERVQHVITHCLEAWAAWGKPLQLKTDNGPAYTAKSFAQFCQRMGISHITGIPYNPQGQGIIERAHRNLKTVLLKQKGGVAEGCTPKQRISLALYTINFLQEGIEASTAADRHMVRELQDYGKVMWKDVLTNTWRGPDDVLTRSRGSLCVSPQGQEPVWVPVRCTRTVED